jgi:hypothetical protein
VGRLREARGLTHATSREKHRHEIGSWIPELSEPLRDDISMRETRLLTLLHERENGASERRPKCAGFNRADVGIVQSSKGLG